VLESLIWTGMALFALACIGGEELPIEAVFVGPALMLIGVILIERKQGKGRARRYSRSSRSSIPRIREYN